MSGPTLDFESTERARLRSALGGLDREIDELKLQTTIDGYSKLSSTVALRFTELVGVLAVPEEPIMRNCPACRSPIRAAATRCKYCWGKSDPAPA